MRKLANFSSPKSTKAALQAALYRARKQRLARLKAQKEAEE